MELFIIFLLTLLNGVLAMSEIAVVSARRARLQQEDTPRAHIALELAEEPTRFLSTVQIGITLIGIMAGTFGGAAVADDAAVFIAQVSFLEPYSDALGLALIIAFTTYLSLVIGELVPKRIGIQDPEGIAMLVAPAMKRLSQIAYPLVWFLTFSTNAVLRVLGIRPSDEPAVTEEEINMMLREGTKAGIFESNEHEMVQAVFRLDDLRVAALMTPRTDMVTLDVNDSLERIKAVITEHFFSQYPVIEESADNIVGYVQTPELIRHMFENGRINLREMAYPVTFVPETVPAVAILDALRQSKVALVLGEHGGIEGLITIYDLLETIISDSEEEDAVQRADGSWLLDGLMPIEEFMDLFDIKDMPDDEDYNTIAGFVLAQLGHIPSAADTFEWENFRFEVIDMDGRRVDKVLVMKMED